MKKLTYEYVKEKIEKIGYKLLSKEYKNASVKLEIKCSKGHQYKATYNHFRQGERCPVCCNNQKYSYNYIKKQFEKEDYKLLSDKYENGLVKLKVECPEYHQYEVKYNNFQQGNRCPICAGTQKLNFLYIKNQIENVGYRLLSKKYKNVKTKLEIECPKGHQYNVKYNKFQQGQRCPICWNISKYSRSEKDCLDIVKQISNEVIIENDRTQIINPKTNQFLELDIWIPSLKKAIEFNGEYWHDNNYKDNIKNQRCKEKNIDILTIWYQDWIDNRENEIDRMKGFIGEK